MSVFCVKTSWHRSQTRTGLDRPNFWMTRRCFETFTAFSNIFDVPMYGTLCYIIYVPSVWLPITKSGTDDIKVKTVPFHRRIYHNVYNDVFVISSQIFRLLFGTFQFLPMVAQLEFDPKFGIWAFGLALQDWRYLDLTLVFKRCSPKIWIFINSTLLNTIEEKRKLNKILVFAKQFFSGATNFLSN